MNIILEPATAEIVEKKSRFIADAAPVADEEEALAFIAGVKKKYWDCKHNCTAFIVGERGELNRCSDDGEPAGTAGRPILELIQSYNLTNICVVVSRYFGGTLLGTGGLVRAYSGAARAAIEAAAPVTKCAGKKLIISGGYELAEKIRRSAINAGAYELSCEYTERVTFSFACAAELEAAISDAVVNATGARVSIEAADDIFYVLSDNKIKLL